MIDRHWDGIVAYCKPENKVSLGFVEGLNKVVERDASDRALHGTGTHADITLRKEQEERIARLTRIHRVLSGINSAIVRIRDCDALFKEACRIAASRAASE